MGVNIFAISPDNSDGVIDGILQMLNETKAYRRYFDWCDLYKGTDAKPVMTLPEALAFDDDSGPFYVFDPLMARASKLYVTNDGMRSIRNRWHKRLSSYPVECSSGHPTYVLFIKARG